MTVDGFKPPSYYSQPPRHASAPALVALVAILLVVVVGSGAAFALKIGPFAPAAMPQAALPSPTAPPGAGSSASPVLTPLPGSTPEPEPTTKPTEIPPPSHVPATPNSAMAELLSHVPEGIRDSCLPTDFLEPILAMVSCVIGDGEITVDYSSYPDPDSMYAAYDERVRVAEIETDSGLCFSTEGGTIGATPDRWPAEHHYNVAGLPYGRYLCVNPPPSLPSINWTDDSLTILGVASAGPAFVDRLVTFWVNDAGPVR